MAIPVAGAAAGAVGGVPSSLTPDLLPGQFSIRTVLDAFAHSGLYSLVSERGQLITCRDMFDSGSMPIGAHGIGMYSPGSSVVVYQPPGQMPIILGAIPSVISDPRLSLPDSIVLCSRVGAWEDALHSDPLRDPANNTPDFSGTRPSDALPGDWGRINDLGLSFFLGRMMAMLRASDGAQIQAFWGDDLLRLIGYNMEIFTSGVEERRLNDQGEYQEIWRSSPFPWEAMGKGGARGETHDGEKGEPLAPERNYAPVEPKEDDQLIVPRHFRARGYLGDVEREYVCIPPAGLDISRYQNPDVYLGAMEIAKHIDGSYSVRSAKQITLEKYVLIPIPKELIAPEDATGDTEENYKFAGQHGDGPDHEMKEFEWDGEEAGVRSQQLWDYHAYLFGKYTQLAFLYHKKDWHLPEEEDLVAMASRASVFPSAAQMGHKFYADLPVPTEIKIDERTDHASKFYATRSLIKQFDDGSVLFEGGFGEQIRLEGGNIFLSCPGDIWRQPGRNDVAWAPHDVILKAGNSADISAAKKDVRIKAEQNLHFLAANRKNGSILIECRGSAPPALAGFKDKLGESVEGSGIFIKGPKTAVTIWAQRIYGGGSEKISGKQIVFDAGEDGDVFLRGNNLDAQGKSSSRLSTGEPGNADSHVALTPSVLSIDVPNTIVGGGLIMPGKSGPANLQVAANVTVGNALLADGGIVTNSGISAYKQEHLASRDQKVRIPDAASQGSIVTQNKSRIEASGERKKEPFFEGNDALGGVEMSQAVGFSCRRTLEDLKLEEDNFVIRGARWQTLIVVGGDSNTWDEPEVRYPDEDGGEITYPHPGKEAWEDWGEALSMLNGGANYDPEDGLPEKHEALIPNGRALTKSGLKDNYPINIQE